ncbi:MAG: RNA 3'-terminal phosphate cyclase [Candidatus Helarchaeota archaeon]
MLEIDGSYGEGGGQVLRTSIALASLLNIPIRIYNIRANRPKPGLKTQHLIGIKAASKICNANIEGAKLNSQEVIFRPNEIKGGNFKIEISTAGSISLILQVLMPIIAFAPRNVNLTITGGTDVNWSPPIDYIINVIQPIMKLMGYNFQLKINKRGHYPKGGGMVSANFEPTQNLKSLNIKDYTEIKYIEGISHCVRLPKHVAIRQMNAANKVLRENGFQTAKIRIESYRPDRDPHLGPGSGIVLWAIPDNNIPLGSDSYGEKGKTAETVGQEAAKSLVEELKSRANVDIHAADFLIPYIALAKGESVIKTRTLTNHIKTNIDITSMILGIDFKIKKTKNGLYEISVNGIGLKNKYL